MFRQGLIVAVSLLLAVGVIFALAPGVDLAAARFFWGGDGFVGVTPVGEALRTIGHQLPFWLLGLAVAAWLARRIGLWRGRAPTGRAVAYLIVSLALGPGLLVNVTLKDNSHRPRPVQTQTFGGPWEFRPWYRFDGACEHNCSFVSGEASSAFWTLAPALLAPPTVRPVAVVAALTFGTAVAALRMAFGGHYLSDSLMSALLTVLLTMGLYWLFFRRRRAVRPSRMRGDDRDLRPTSAPL